MSTKSFAKWLWPRDERAPQQIDAEIREELAAHYDQLIADEQRAGAAPDEAERIARERFGDLDGYADECRRIDLRDRLIVRRVLSVACLLLLVACGGLVYRLWTVETRLAQLAEQQSSREQTAQRGTSSPAPESLTDEAWIERLIGLRDHLHTALAIGPELTLLDPDRGADIVRMAWPRLQTPDVKTGLLKAFAFSKALKPDIHPRLFEVLHLGMRDENREVVRFAAHYLQEYAGEDFQLRPADYARWFAVHGRQSPDEVARLDE